MNRIDGAIVDPQAEGLSIIPNDSISCTKDWGNNSINNLTQNRPAITQDILAAYNMFLYAIIALGVSGNLIVLFVFVKHKPVSTTDWFILFIATCDFVTSVFNVPVYVTFTNTVWAKYGNDVICKLHMFLSQSIVLSELFLICGLALERYLKICKPNNEILTSKRARAGCLVVTLVTAVLSIPCFWLFRNVGSNCVSVSMDTLLFCYYLMVFIVFCLATLVVIISYTNVVITVRNSERKILDHQMSAFAKQKQRPRRSSFFSWFLNQRKVVEPPSTSSVVAETNSTRCRRPSKPTVLTANTMEMRALFSFKGDLTDTPKQMKTITLASSVSNIDVIPEYLMTAPTSGPAKPNVSSARDQIIVQGIRSASIITKTSEKATSNVWSAKEQPIDGAILSASIRAQTSENVTPIVSSSGDQPMDQGILSKSITAQTSVHEKLNLSSARDQPMVRCFQSAFITAQTSDNVKPNVSSARDQHMDRCFLSDSIRAQTSENVKPNVPSARDQPMDRGIRIESIRAQTSENVKPNTLSARDQYVDRGILSQSTRAQTSEMATPNVSSARIQQMARGIRNASVRAICTTFLVCAIFVISWIPPWICFFLVTEPGYKLKPTVVRYMMFGRMTYLLNTVANPIIYVGFNKKFREKVRGLVCFK